MIEFAEFTKIARLCREMTICEKIDGTNASICIGADGEFLIGSRTRWITPDNDNHGFAKWANDNKDELLKLGVGMHYGEWWGPGIQRSYGLKNKCFSLFNVHRWQLPGKELRIYKSSDPKIPDKSQEYCPQCCSVVPILYEGIFDTQKIDEILINLDKYGSIVSPGFMRPEGIVIWHHAARTYFKKTIDNDLEGKTKNEQC